MTPEPVLEFRDVTYHYPGGVTAVEALTFTINAGEAVSIVGPNGGGKTTLVKLALGLLKPACGSIRLLGQAPEHACRRAGYVPQIARFDAAFPIRCADVVRMGCLGVQGAGRKLKATGADVTAALERVGCADLARRPFARVSGGQRQRVLIARALIGQPEVVFLDEPTNHIDPDGETRIRDILRELRAAMTVITVTHDLNFVAAEVEKVVCVDRTAHLHPTSALADGLQAHLFNRAVSIVRHDECLTHGHQCH